jgi:hypothetical protein
LLDFGPELLSNAASTNTLTDRPFVHPYLQPYPSTLSTLSTLIIELTTIMEGQEQPDWDWDTLERVYAYGINTGESSGDQVEEYMLTKMHVYKKNNFKDYTL